MKGGQIKGVRQDSRKGSGLRARKTVWLSHDLPEWAKAFQPEVSAARPWPARVSIPPCIEITTFNANGCQRKNSPRNSHSRGRKFNSSHAHYWGTFVFVSINGGQPGGIRQVWSAACLRRWVESALSFSPAGFGVAFVSLMRNFNVSYDGLLCRSEWGRNPGIFCRI